MPYKDLEVKKQFLKEYQKKHKDRLNAYSRTYHKDYVRTLKSRWYLFNWKATNRGHVVELTFEEWVVLVDDAVCHYCFELIQTKGGGSLDRKDSSLGYTKDNVVPCCSTCNRVKNNLITYEEMCYIMPLLIKYRKERTQRGS